jgi:hypothetical protein
MVSAWRLRIQWHQRENNGLNESVSWRQWRNLLSGVIVMAWRNAILIYLKSESSWRKRNEKLSYVAANAAESVSKIMKIES